MKFKPFPRGKFKIIEIDPPWPYKDKGAAGKRGASQKYKTIPLAQLILLPVEKLAARNCIMAMWTTDTFMVEALALMKGWGFRYVRVGFVWVKVNKNKKTFKMTLGRYTRSNAEFVLFGVKGKPKRKHYGINQVVATIPEGHSKKPVEVKIRLEKLYGKVPRVDLFARGNRKKLRRGWKYWGKQLI